MAAVQKNTWKIDNWFSKIFQLHSNLSLRDTHGTRHFVLFGGVPYGRFECLFFLKFFFKNFVNSSVCVLLWIIIILFIIPLKQSDKAAISKLQTIMNYFFPFDSNKNKSAFVIVNVEFYSLKVTLIMLKNSQFCL